MSKVIHLSDDAHNKAKAYCREHGVKMSDWVATLIDVAVAHGGTPMAAPPVGNVRALVQKKKIVETPEGEAPTTADGLPVYASPPFWAAKATS